MKARSRSRQQSPITRSLRDSFPDNMQLGLPTFLFFLSLIITAASSSPDFDGHDVYAPLRERGSALSRNEGPQLPKDTPFGGIECSGPEKIYCQSRCHCSATGQVFCQKKHKKLAAPTIAFLEAKLLALCSPKCECKLDKETTRGGVMYEQWSKFVKDQGQGWGTQEK